MLSYLAAPLRYSHDDRRLAGHSNAWECRAIGSALQRCGLTLDAIDWSDDAFVPTRDYRLIFDLHRNLERLGSRAEKRWLHVTGSHPRFAHEAEAGRLRALFDRRSVCLSTRRAFDAKDTARFERSLEIADVISVIGDDVTLSTFSRTVADKSERVYVTGSPLAARRRDDNFNDRTFLWFAGSGAVHKGLDLVLECFAANPQLTLHCIGPYEQETDFVAAFRRELYETPNIVSHGWMIPSDPAFVRIAERAAAFVLPSCSEGMSPAAVTCMQFGLVPIVTRRCGLDLPPGAGVVLDDSGSALEAAVTEVAERPRDQLAEQIGAVRRLARDRHSRAAFQARMNDLVARHVRGDQDG